MSVAQFLGNISGGYLTGNHRPPRSRNLGQAEALNPSHSNFKRDLKQIESAFLDQYCDGLRLSSKKCGIERRHCQNSERLEWSKLIVAICKRIAGGKAVEKNLAEDRFVLTSVVKALGDESTDERAAEYVMCLSTRE